MKMIDDDFNESEMFGSKAQAPAQAPATASGGNPLFKYFRMPGLSVRLPTNGRYLPEGAIELDATGQVSIYPMRAADELLLKAPDALMSGVAVEKLIESCVPAIKTPGLISAPDLDVLLLAIRAATYGNTMPIEVECPECEHEMAFDCDLPSILQTMVDVPETLDVRLSPEVVVTMKPHTLTSQTKLLLAAYEEQRYAQMVDTSNMGDDEKKAIFKRTLEKITEFQTQSIASGVFKVTVPGQEVTDPAHIYDFVSNTDRNWSDKLRQKLEEINSMGIDRNLPAECEKCHHKWQAKLEFNPATFFEQSSSA
jgi:hypothetical protein